VHRLLEVMSCHSWSSCTWIIQGLIGLCVWFGGYFVVRFFLQKSKIWIRLDLEQGPRVVLPAMKVLFGTLGIYYIFYHASLHGMKTSYLETIRPIRDTLLVLSLFWMLYRLQQEYCRTRVLRMHGVAFTFGKIFSIGLVLVTGLILLRIFNVDIMPLLAFGGIGAAVLGFAAKDVMSSFVGGVMLSITRPFALHETILLPERELEGVVEEMGWCLTVLRDKDQRLAYLPNALFSQTLVINLSRRIGRRILETIHLRRVDACRVDVIRQQVQSTLMQMPCIDTKMPILLFVNALGDYAVELQFDVYTKATSLQEYAKAKDLVLRALFVIVQEQGAELAYPVLLMGQPT